MLIMSLGQLFREIVPDKADSTYIGKSYWAAAEHINLIFIYMI